jgi:hypothetical protein
MRDPESGPSRARLRGLPRCRPNRLTMGLSATPCSPPGSLNRVRGVTATGCRRREGYPRLVGARERLRAPVRWVGLPGSRSTCRNARRLARFSQPGGQYETSRSRPQIGVRPGQAPRTVERSAASNHRPTEARERHAPLGGNSHTPAQPMVPLLGSISLVRGGVRLVGLRV